MLKKLQSLFKRYKEIIIYLLFGGITTVANYVVYLPLYNMLQLPAALCNILAWAFAVIVAYVTNKPFVFKSYDWSAKVLVPEFLKFVGCRVASGLLETLVIWVTVDIWRWDGNIVKLIVSVAVVIMNYIGSKLLVFRR